MYEGKKILVLGGSGSIGSELVAQLLQCKPSKIRVFSRSQNQQYAMMLQYPEHEKQGLRFILGDIRDKYALNEAMKGVDIVIHAAAFKYVDLSEYNARETVNVNIIGTMNAIECALENKVKRFLFISTDKSCSPYNLMGATKMIGEMLVTHYNGYPETQKTIFAVVRFGNVLFSTGSVLNIWKEQMKRGYITLTDSRMCRFFMTKEQAVSLVLKACKLAKGGEIFVLKMPVVRMKDMAEVYAEKHGVMVKETGIRIGEKLHEQLFTDDEFDYLHDNGEMYMIDKTKRNTKLLVAPKSTGEITPISKDEIKVLLGDVLQ